MSFDVFLISALKINMLEILVLTNQKLYYILLSCSHYGIFYSSYPKSVFDATVLNSINRNKLIKEKKQ